MKSCNFQNGRPRHEFRVICRFFILHLSWVGDRVFPEVPNAFHARAHETRSQIPRGVTNCRAPPSVFGFSGASINGHPGCNIFAARAAVYCSPPRQVAVYCSPPAGCSIVQSAGAGCSILQPGRQQYCSPGDRLSRPQKTQIQKAARENFVIPDHRKRKRNPKNTKATQKITTGGKTILAAGLQYIAARRRAAVYCSPPRPGCSILQPAAENNKIEVFASVRFSFVFCSLCLGRLVVFSQNRWLQSTDPPPPHGFHRAAVYCSPGGLYVSPPKKVTPTYYFLRETLPYQETKTGKCKPGGRFVYRLL